MMSVESWMSIGCLTLRKPSTVSDKKFLICVLSQWQQKALRHRVGGFFRWKFAIIIAEAVRQSISSPACTGKKLRAPPQSRQWHEFPNATISSQSPPKIFAKSITKISNRKFMRFYWFGRARLVIISSAQTKGRGFFCLHSKKFCSR